MAQYINKSILVEEIERKKIPFKRDIEDGNYPTYLCALMDFEDFINTLEVKEVDLEKEIKSYLNNQPIVTRSQGIDYKLVPSPEKIAKHFFEFGLAQLVKQH